MGRIVNKRDLSDILGVSERTLTEWQRDGLPIVYAGERGESNQYDTEQVIAWWIAREVQKGQTESQRDRLARLQADRVAIDIDEKLKRLIPAEMIEPAWAAMVQAARSFLRAEPSRLAHLLEVTEGEEAKRDLLAETFDELLRKLSGYEPPDADDEPASNPGARAQGVEEDGSAAEDDGCGVGGALSLPVG